MSAYQIRKKKAKISRKATYHAQQKWFPRTFDQSTTVEQIVGKYGFFFFDSNQLEKSPK